MSHKSEITDEQLTAYALGELEGGDLDRVGAYVARDAGARRHVEDIRATAQLLTNELSGSRTMSYPPRTAPRSSDTSSIRARPVARRRDRTTATGTPSDK